jgi:hypothetical protein
MCFKVTMLLEPDSQFHARLGRKYLDGIGYMKQVGDTPIYLSRFPIQW